MELRLQRHVSMDGCTLGELFVDDTFACFSLEDVVREGPKVIHETAIPAGRYRVTITRSQRFGRMLPLLLDVPGFTGIRIHSGNVAGDSSGCILVGRAKQVDRLFESRVAMDALQAQLAGALARQQDVFITIVNASPIHARNA